jgi:hypothetical protein
MMHFFRRSKINLDCFTEHKWIIESAPVDHAIKHIPNWWKALPKERYEDGKFFPLPTMKTCVGMYDYYVKSVCLPLWSDLAINVDSNLVYKWQFADGNTEAVVHSSAQYAGFDVGSAGHLKIEAPWVLKEKTGVDWVYSSPIYAMNNITDYTVTPGILNFKYQHGINIQLFINLERAKTFKVAYNTPMAFLTPMSDKKVVIHRHLLAKEEYERMQKEHIPGSFINKYVNTKNAQNNKCPYKDYRK